MNFNDPKLGYPIAIIRRWTIVCFADNHMLLKISHFYVSEHCRIDFSQLIYLEEVTIYVADLEHQFDWLGKIYGWRSPCLKKVTFEVEEGPLYTPLTDSTWDKLDGIVSRSWGVWVPRKWTQKAVEITCSWISRVFTGESGPQLLIVRKNPSENITLDLFFNKCCRRGITVKSKNLNSPEMEK